MVIPLCSFIGSISRQDPKRVVVARLSAHKSNFVIMTGNKAYIIKNLTPSIVLEILETVAEPHYQFSARSKINIRIGFTEGLISSSSIFSKAFLRLLA